MAYKVCYVNLSQCKFRKTRKYRLSRSLQQLNAITEWVEDKEPFITFQRQVFDAIYTRSFATRAKNTQVVNQKRWVRLGGRAEIPHYTKVNLDLTVLEPAPTSFLELFGFLHFCEAEDTGIKAMSFQFPAVGHGQLNVVY